MSNAPPTPSLLRFDWVGVLGRLERWGQSEQDRVDHVWQWRPYLRKASPLSPLTLRAQEIGRCFPEEVKRCQRVLHHTAQQGSAHFARLLSDPRQRILLAAALHAQEDEKVQVRTPVAGAPNHSAAIQGLSRNEIQRSRRRARERLKRMQHPKKRKVQARQKKTAPPPSSTSSSSSSSSTGDPAGPPVAGGAADGAPTVARGRT